MELKQQFYLTNPKWATNLQMDYELYMMGCESLIDDDSAFQTLSGAPFCGCSTCYTREQLMFLVPQIIAAYNEGIIVLEESISE